MPDDTYKPQITDKKINLSLIDDNSIGLNMYFKTVNCDCNMVRVSYADQPDKVFYLPVKNDYSTGSHSLSVRVNSGEITQKMKLDPDRDISNYSFSLQIEKMKIQQDILA